ncbi:MAG: hypothetical protein QOD25_3221, partial [Alphaproteobacteria bacterium]|nr:hypothetical protein [Alphaproteobacteria bacterium]
DRIIWEHYSSDAAGPETVRYG